MRRLLAVIVVGAVVSHGAREARAQAVMGGPYSGSYRVSDYFAAPRALWHELRLRQLRRSSNVHHFLGLSRALLRLKRSGLRLSSRPLWRRPLASRLHGAWLRLRSAHLWELVPHLPCRLRHQSDRRPDCPAAVDRRLCTSSGTEHRPLRPLDRGREFLDAKSPGRPRRRYERRLGACREAIPTLRVLLRALLHDSLGDGQAAGLLAVDVLAGPGREDRR